MIREKFRIQAAFRIEHHGFQRLIDESMVHAHHDQCQQYQGKYRDFSAPRFAVDQDQTGTGDCGDNDQRKTKCLVRRKTRRGQQVLRCRIEVRHPDFTNARDHKQRCRTNPRT